MYLNRNNKQFLLHFPFKTEINTKILFTEELKRDIKVSENISIIVVIKDFENTLIKEQLNLNHINFIYTKEDNLYKALKNVKTDYTLIINNNDCLILENLDDIFINSFDNLNLNYIFAGLDVQEPLIDIEDLNSYYLQGRNKYLNCSLIFGKTKEITELFFDFIFYRSENINLFKQYKIKNEDYYQLYMKMLMVSKINNKEIKFLPVDSTNKLFTSITFINDFIIESKGIKYIDYRNNLYNYFLL